MDSERNIEGFSLNEPPFFENENFVEWKNEFESYVKSIDHDLWYVISIGDFQPNFDNHNFIRKFCKKIDL